MRINNILKSKIKKGRLGKVATKLGDIYSFPCSVFLDKIKNAKSGDVVLIGTPTHHNIGDHLLANNEIEFLINECKVSRVIEIPTRIFLHNEQKILARLNKNIPIFITGGGWMGDIWPEDEEILEHIVYSFRNNKVIIFPQTIYYGDVKQCETYIEQTKKNLTKATDLLIMCRERKSYDLMVDKFSSKNVKIELWADMGLYPLPQFSSQLPRKGIGLCLRDDREKIENIDVLNIIKKYIAEEKKEIYEVTTISNNPIPKWKRKKILHKTASSFSKCELVITDRLHGMIFAAITDTRCIALDNKSHKVKGVYDLWLKNNKNIIFADENTFEDSFKQLYTNSNNINDEWNKAIKQHFKRMGESIMDELREKECIGNE